MNKIPYNTILRLREKNIEVTGDKISLELSHFHQIQICLQKNELRVIDRLKNTEEKTQLSAHQKTQFRIVTNQQNQSKQKKILSKQLLLILRSDEEQCVLLGGGGCMSCNQNNTIPELRIADTEDIEDLNNDSIIFHKNEDDKEQLVVERNFNFQQEYEKFVDHQRIGQVIAENSYFQEINLILDGLLYQNRLAITASLETYKLQIMHLFEIIINYILSSAQFQTKEREKELQKSMQTILDIITPFSNYLISINFDCPCLDIIFMLEMVRRLNSMRAGSQEINKIELEKIAAIASSMSLYSINLNTSLSYSQESLNIQEQNIHQLQDLLSKIKLKSKSQNMIVIEDVQLNLTQYLTTNLYQFIVSLWVNRFEQFKLNFLNTSLIEDIDFFITKLLTVRLPGSKNIIIYLLVKINTLLDTGLSEDSNEFTKVLAEHFMLSQLNYSKLLAFIGVIQPKEQDLINQYKEIVVQMRHPEFRFIGMQILLKLVYVMNHIDASQVESIMIHLCTQYLCESDQSVKIVFKNNVKMQNFLKKIKNNKNAKQQVRDYSVQRRKQLTIVMEVDEQIHDK